IAYFDSALDALPSRRHVGHFLARTRMESNGGWLFSEKSRKPCFKFIFRVPYPCFYRNRQSRAFRRAYERACKPRIFHERGTAAAALNGPVGTPHVDVNAVEAQLNRDVCGFFHPLRYCREKLN